MIMSVDVRALRDSLNESKEYTSELETMLDELRFEVRTLTSLCESAIEALEDDDDDDE